MKVEELIKDFEGERRPYVAAAAFLGIHPRTISVWEEKNGKVPEQWAALYRERKGVELCDSNNARQVVGHRSET